MNRSYQMRIDINIYKFFLACTTKHLHDKYRHNKYIMLKYIINIILIHIVNQSLDNVTYS
jgi:hypothetical protein